MLLSPASDARTSRGHGSMKTVTALLLVGMLILWAELPTGRRCPWGKSSGAGKEPCLHGCRGREGCVFVGQHLPVPLSCPGANSSLLWQAAPGPVRPCASPAPCTTRGTCACSTDTAPVAGNAAAPSAARNASPGRLAPSTVGAREPAQGGRAGYGELALALSCVQAGRVTVDKPVGCEQQTKPISFSPFSSVSSGFQDRLRVISAFPPQLQDHSVTVTALCCPLPFSLCFFTSLLTNKTGFSQGCL